MGWGIQEWVPHGAEPTGASTPWFFLCVEIPEGSTPWEIHESYSGP